MGWLDKLKSPVVTTKDERQSFPEGLWTKCPRCQEIIFQDDITKNLSVCPNCEYHFRMDARERLDMLLEPDSFEELDKNMLPSDPLEFRDQKKYKDRLKALEKSSPETEAFIYGRGKIKTLDLIIGSFVFGYMAGSMGSVVGEKLTRTFELAERELKPCLVITASGGARMQEGVLSLMQMAKSSAALARLRAKNLPFIAYLSDPTTGGVAASVAMLGDVILAEPNALIGFAGPRVIEQTIKEKLPEGFQMSEFLLEHGMIDRIVKRSEAKDTLFVLLSHLTGKSVS